jgi:hypothetical protein
MIVPGNLDPAIFEPSLDESCRRDEQLGTRGLVADQSFGQDALVSAGGRVRAGQLDGSAIARNAS